MEITTELAEYYSSAIELRIRNKKLISLKAKTAYNIWAYKKHGTKTEILRASRTNTKFINRDLHSVMNHMARAEKFKHQWRERELEKQEYLFRFYSTGRDKVLKAQVIAMLMLMMPAFAFVHHPGRMEGLVGLNFPEASTKLPSGGCWWAWRVCEEFLDGVSLRLRGRELEPPCGRWRARASSFSQGDTLFPLFHHQPLLFSLSLHAFPSAFHLKAAFFASFPPPLPSPSPSLKFVIRRD